jgi:hypothetical protein
MRARRHSQRPLEADVPAPELRTIRNLTIDRSRRSGGWKRAEHADRHDHRRADAYVHSSPPFGETLPTRRLRCSCGSGHAGQRPIAERSGSERESEGRRRLSLPLRWGQGEARRRRRESIRAAPKRTRTVSCGSARLATGAASPSRCTARRRKSWCRTWEVQRPRDARSPLYAATQFALLEPGVWWCCGEEENGD